MKNVVIVAVIAALAGGGWLAYQRVAGYGARNEFVAKADKLAYEVTRLHQQGRPSVGEVEALFVGWVEASPEVTLVEGGLDISVVPFECGGKDEPPELKKLPTIDRGNARNLAVRCKNVELVGLRAELLANGEPFRVEEWALLADR